MAKSKPADLPDLPEDQSLGFNEFEQEFFRAGDSLADFVPEPIDDFSDLDPIDGQRQSASSKWAAAARAATDKVVAKARSTSGSARKAKAAPVSAKEPAGVALKSELLKKKVPRGALYGGAALAAAAVVLVLVLSGGSSDSEAEEASASPVVSLSESPGPAEARPAAAPAEAPKPATPPAAEPEPEPSPEPLREAAKTAPIAAVSEPVLVAKSAAKKPAAKKPATEAEEAAPPAAKPAAAEPAPVPAVAQAEPAPAKAAKPKKTAKAERKKDRKRAKSKYQRGLKAYKSGDLGGAQRHFKDALSSDAGYAPAYRGLGLAYRRAGKQAKAKRYLRKYLRAAPKAKDAKLVKKLIAQL